MEQVEVMGSGKVLACMVGRNFTVVEVGGCAGI